MTPQEALGLLNDMEFAEQYQGKQEYTNMLLLCKKALEKQIPKKVIFMSDKSKVCGRCKQRVLSHQPYCEDCGQALD